MNKIEKALATFGKYVQDSFTAFIEGIKLKPQKIVTLILLVPGLLFGLTMDWHYKAMRILPVSLRAPFKIYDFAGSLLFAIFILTCINMFSGVSFIKKNNYRSTIIITTLSTLITIFAATYFAVFLRYRNQSGSDHFTSAVYLSLMVAGLTVLFSIAGAVFAFIFTNKNYVKVRE